MLAADLRYIHELCAVDDDIYEHLYRHLALMLFNRSFDDDNSRSGGSSSKRSHKVNSLLGAEGSTESWRSIFADVSGTLLRGIHSALGFHVVLSMQ